MVRIISNVLVHYTVNSLHILLSLKQRYFYNETDRRQKEARKIKNGSTENRPIFFFAPVRKGLLVTVEYCIPLVVDIPV